MLIFTRKVDEQVVIGEGPDAVTVTVVLVDRGRVRLGFTGPHSVPIDRKEVRDAKENFPHPADLK